MSYVPIKCCFCNKTINGSEEYFLSNNGNSICDSCIDYCWTNRGLEVEVDWQNPQYVFMKEKMLADLEMMSKALEKVKLMYGELYFDATRKRKELDEIRAK